MPLPQCPEPEELAAFAQGQPTQTSWETLASHVEACTDCQSALNSHQPEKHKLFANAPHLDIDATEPALTRLLAIGDQVPATAAAADSLTVKVYEHGQLTFSARLPNQLELGRQRTDEPPPYQLLRNRVPPRLIIAERTNRHVSRRHLQLTVLENKLVARRLTQKGEVLIEGDIRLSETAELDVPAILLLGAHAVRVE